MNGPYFTPLEQKPSTGRAGRGAGMRRANSGDLSETPVQREELFPNSVDLLAPV